MKYLKVLIVILVIVSVGLISYYLYLLLGGTSKANKIVNSDSERTIQSTKSGSGAIVSEIVDYTSAGVESGKTIKIQGRFQSADFAQKELNGIGHVFVVGLLKEDGSLGRIWLTAGEYEKLEGSLSYGAVIPGQPVTFSISQDSVSFEKADR